MYTYYISDVDINVKKVGEFLQSIPVESHDLFMAVDIVLDICGYQQVTPVSKIAKYLRRHLSCILEKDFEEYDFLRILRDGDWDNPESLIDIARTDIIVTYNLKKESNE